MASNAERFRVLKSVSLEPLWYIATRQGEWLYRDGSVGNAFGVESKLYYASEAEAEFRLALYLDPRTALAAFLTATGGSYEGSCGECNAAGLTNRGLYLATDPPGRKTCPTCHGTGGPPAHAGEIADWYSERGMDTEAEVLKGLANG
jgi:cytochrome c5